MATKQKKTIRTVKKSANTGRLSRSAVRDVIVSVRGSSPDGSGSSMRASEMSFANGDEATAGGATDESTSKSARSTATASGSRDMGAVGPSSDERAES